MSRLDRKVKDMSLLELRNKRIALYGWGFNGKRCYNAMIKQNLCDVALIVDMQYEKLAGEAVKACPPSDLFKCDYDYVFVTIINSEACEAVCRMLVEDGIPESRILTWVSMSRDAYFLEDEGKFEDYLEFMYYIMKNNGRYAWDYYREIALLLEGRDDESISKCRRIEELIAGLKVSPRKLVCLALLYAKGWWNARLMRLFMEALKGSEWEDDTYYGLVIETTLMIHSFEDSIYPEFFADRKMLMSRLCDYYRLKSFAKPVKKETDNRRIAVVSNSYKPSRLTDAVSKLVTAYTEEFAGLGYEVTLFVLMPFLESDNTFLCTRKNTADDAIDFDFLPELKEKNVNVVYCSMTDVSSRLQKHIEDIIDYNPRWIIDMSDETFLEGYALRGCIPIAQFPMRSMSYSSQADLHFIYSSEVFNNSLRTYKDIEDGGAVVVADVGNMGAESEVIPYRREEHGMKQGDFVMVTVGGRLKREVSQEMIDAVCAFLDRHDNFRWLIVGQDVANDGELYRRLVRERRIVYWGYEKNLDNLYAMCDIYLQPDRNGGGVSIRRAMKQGCVVMSRRRQFCNVDYVLPTECTVDGSWEELLEHVLKISADKELYEALSSACRKLTAGCSAAKDAEIVIDFCMKYLG